MLRIFGLPISAHTRKVLIVLHEKGIDYELVPVAPLFSEGPMGPPANWAELSPLGKIPVVQVDGLTIADSSVIGLYLERRQPDPPLYPSEPVELAEALWIEEYVDSGLQQHVLHGLLAEKALARIAMKREPDEALMQRSLTEHIPPKLDYLERRLEGRSHFAGERFTIADITVASILINYHYAGAGLSRQRHPSLFRHLHRQLARPSFQKAFEVELPAARRLPTLDVSLLEQSTQQV